MVLLPPFAPLPQCSLILAMSRRKLLANKSSASSMTSVLTPCVFNTPMRDISAILPGVPTTINGLFFLKPSSCRLAFAPPINCCVISFPYGPSTVSIVLTICIANSCDGATIIARTSFTCLFWFRSIFSIASSSLKMSQNIGIKYASVLPDPVCDCIAIDGIDTLHAFASSSFSPPSFLKSINSGKAANCATDGFSMPALRSKSTICFGTPKSANDDVCFCCCCCCCCSEDTLAE